MVEHSHRNTRALRNGHRLYDENPAARVGVVREHVDEHLAPAGEHGDIAHRDGRQIFCERFFNIDTNDANDRVRAIGDEVLRVVGAPRFGLERERPGRVVGNDLGARDLIEAGQTQRHATGAHVVNERRDRDGLADTRLHVVCVGDGLCRTDGAHVDTQHSLGVAGAVRHDDRDLFAALHLARRAECDLTVGRELDLVAIRHGGGLQEEVIAVGVKPVGQHVV